MKKMVMLMMVGILTILTSVAMADDQGSEKAGKLFLFQKCDASLATDTTNYDAKGCPKLTDGPWPIYSGNNRMGILNYNLWGTSFKFSFEGKKLEANKKYTLIYYPDPWPGDNLICLGSATSSKEGKIKIRSNGVALTTGLPIKDDDNNQLGAKIWLVATADVDCTANAPLTTKMNSWNPASYLFEYNLIVFEKRTTDENDDEEDDD
jgi:hypothetical protein